MVDYYVSVVPDPEAPPPSWWGLRWRGSAARGRLCHARPVTSVHETVLYASDVGAATRFYADVVGLRVVFERGGLMAALRLDTGGVLLLFDPAESEAGGRDVPSHGARGPGHVAFTVSESELAAMRERLTAAGAGVERELAWPRGGRSLYVRDPAGNSVEFVLGEIWPD